MVVGSARWPSYHRLMMDSAIDLQVKEQKNIRVRIGTHISGYAKRKEQAALFGKHQPPKKRRKSRTAFTNQQIYELEKRFLYQKYLTPADRDEIALNLGLTNAQVITWFQNRRAKLKRDLEEMKNDVEHAKTVAGPTHLLNLGLVAQQKYKCVSRQQLQIEEDDKMESKENTIS
eukprot:XP_014775739.1 PREDICTED: transcription factor LBX1-like [Octopus bimaculoides]